MNKKFRCFDVKKREYIKDFILAPTSPFWGAFNYIEPTEKIKKIMDEEFHPFGWFDYSLFDWADFSYLTKGSFIVEMFTNKYDMNNIEIWEGSVLKSIDDDSFSYVVKFIDGAFEAVDMDGSDLHFSREFWSSRGIVIGDIHYFKGNNV